MNVEKPAGVPRLRSVMRVRRQWSIATCTSSPSGTDLEQSSSPIALRVRVQRPRTYRRFDVFVPRWGVVWIRGVTGDVVSLSLNDDLAGHVYVHGFRSAAVYRVAVEFSEVTYIDSFLLNLTERFCRRFQLLTGRTNVWLALQLTNLS